MARYIDADELRDEVDSTLNWNTNNEYNMYSDVMDMIDNAPTEDVQPVIHAEWKEIKEYEHDKLPIVYECSGCGYQYHTQRDGKFKHCPCCGAKMDEKEVK